MILATRRSRNCVLRLLTLTLSSLLFLYISATISLWPTLVLTPKGITLPEKPTASTHPSTLKSSHNTKILDNDSSASASSPPKRFSSVFNENSLRNVLVNSPAAPTNSVMCHPASHLFKPVKHSRLSPHLCKHLTTHKMTPPASPLRKKSPVFPQKVPLNPSKPEVLYSSAPSFPFSRSNSLPSSRHKKSHTSLSPPPPASYSNPLKFTNTLPTLSTREETFFHHPREPVLPSLPRTAEPLFQHQPFIVTWNIPNLVCNRYNILLDTSPFKGVATPAKVPGQFLSLFYTDRLGFYPHVNLSSRKQFYGGIPQRSNLKASINKARADVNYYIPSKTTRGLAVIDWEEWRPLWDRNWGAKRVYRTLSVAHAMQTNHSLTMQEATDNAKQEFQEAAKELMSGMLSMGRSMRSNYLWGFYLFPNCYNHNWHEPDYTGQCSKEVKGQNDELLWLWEASTALYPSVYLQASLADSPKAALMVKNRVQEALRVSALTKSNATAPVFVYMRPVFIDQNKRFLSLGDLISTIGESAAVGASGAVLWGASADYDDQSSCEALSSYLTSTINPYIANVTAAAQVCSDYLCRGNGRCVRRNYKSHHYLHLNPDAFRVLRVQKRYLVLGRPTLADLKSLSRSFTCQCYKGLSCTPRTYRELSKALMFNVKQGQYHKTHSFAKAALDKTQQASITKENFKQKLKN